MTESGYRFFEEHHAEVRQEPVERYIVGLETRRIGYAEAQIAKRRSLGTARRLGNEGGRNIETMNTPARTNLARGLPRRPAPATADIGDTLPGLEVCTCH